MAEDIERLSNILIKKLKWELGLISTDPSKLLTSERGPEEAYDAKSDDDESR